MKKLTFAFATVLLFAFHPSGRAGEKPVPKEQDFDNFKALAAAIAKADKVVLFEGLPHPDEKELYKQELKTKKTVERYRFDFYEEKIKLKEGHDQELTKLFTDEQSFAKYRGPKKCGDFHPDYLIEWHVGKEIYLCFVCFGCSEVKYYGPKLELYCDMGEEDNRKKIKEFLKQYRNQRPKEK